MYNISLFNVLFRKIIVLKGIFVLNGKIYQWSICIRRIKTSKTIKQQINVVAYRWNTQKKTHTSRTSKHHLTEDYHQRPIQKINHQHQSQPVISTKHRHQKTGTWCHIFYFNSSIITIQWKKG